MKLRTRPAALFTIAALAAGCGSSGQAATTAATTNATRTATTTATTTNAAPTSSSFASNANCQQLASLGLSFERALAAARAGGTQFAGVAAFQALANAAPSEIRPDLQLVARAFATYAASLAKLGLKAGTAPTPTQMSGIYVALQAFGAPPVRAATARVRAWVHRNCGTSS